MVGGSLNAPTSSGGVMGVTVLLQLVATDAWRHTFVMGLACGYKVGFAEVG